MNETADASMAGRTVLVTGGTGGIGKATALGLATMGARVAITGRNPERAEHAARAIRAAGGGTVDVLVGDMSSQSQARRLAEEILQNLPRIDVLVNNVGGYWNSRHVTADGLERTFALNHLASFLLTNLLLDRLTRSSPARVVTVSSQAHVRGRIQFADLQGESSYSGARAYGQSKLANVMFCYELARRLRGGGVTATVLHPGVGRTAFGAEDPGSIQRLLVPLARRFMNSPEQGASPRSTWPLPPNYGTCQVSTSPTACPSGHPSAATTKRPPPDSGRSAPTWSAYRNRPDSARASRERGTPVARYVRLSSASSITDPPTVLRCRGRDDRRAGHGREPARPSGESLLASAARGS